MNGMAKHFEALAASITIPSSSDRNHWKHCGREGKEGKGREGREGREGKLNEGQYNISRSQTGTRHFACILISKKSDLLRI